MNIVWKNVEIVMVLTVLRICMMHNRERKSERTALTWRAFSFDTPAVRLHDVPGNRQTQPAPPTFLTSRHTITGFRSRAIDLIETLKDARQVFGRNTGPCIAHKKTLCRPLAARVGSRADDHCTAGRRKLNGVVQQIDQHARDLLANGSHQPFPLLD